MLEQDHGFSKTLGLRFGKVGYSTDVVRLDETAFDILAGVELFIVGCLREEPHPTHVDLPTVLTWIERINPKVCHHTYEPYAGLRVRKSEVTNRGRASV